MALSSSRPVNRALVNWLPWSVLKISGLPCLASASSTASRQNVDFHRDRHPPRQDPAAEPVDDGRQVDEAARHRDVGDVHRPHLVGPLDRQPAQQVRIDLVAGRRLRRVRPAVERLDPHAPHQRRDVPAADRDALATQQVAQHPAARERVVQMQLVDPPHHRQIGRRHRPRQVVDAAPAELQDLRLPRQRQLVRAVDHRFALSMPALLSAPAKKSFSSASSPILACSAFKSTAGAAAGLAAPEPNTAGRALEQLALPVRDLVGVHIEQLRQLRQRLLALDGGQRHLRLEGRCVVPARSFAHGLS